MSMQEGRQSDGEALPTAPSSTSRRVARVRAVVDLAGVSPELRELLDTE